MRCPSKPSLLTTSEILSVLDAQKARSTSVNNNLQHAAQWWLSQHS